MPGDWFLSPGQEEIDQLCCVGLDEASDCSPHQPECGGRLPLELQLYHHLNHSGRQQAIRGDMAA